MSKEYWNKLAEEGGGFISGFYSTSLAKKYATPWDVPIEYNEYAIGWVKQYCPQFVQFDCMKILDIGCGWGWFARHFATQPVFYWGIDISGYNIGRLKEQFCFHTDCNFVEVVGDGTLPFENDSFDLVIEKAVFYHTSFEVTKKYIEETVRVLKPGGLYALQFAERSKDSIFKTVKRRRIISALPGCSINVEENNHGVFLQVSGRKE